MNKIREPVSSIAKMPVLFLGHGSPMNAIGENEFVKGWRNIGKTIPKPAAVLCISAHWETRGTYVTAMDRPMTIHDFGGFPDELYEVQYPASGSPELAMEIKSIVTNTPVGLDEKWGLDHGCWSVIKHLYPDAGIPVIQMSMDYNMSAQQHYELSKELAVFRNKGILIVASGNIVHNLEMVAWNRLNDNYGYDWAIEANEKMKQFILNADHKQLINYKSQGRSFDLAIPTPDHFLPLLYALALQEKEDAITIFNDKPVGGSLTMTSIKIG
ncbi:MAG TPA: 4,5-DOPA dioxygenase extradiol [Bacteroidales bacterium]|nr:4,5-DOPA dioxygenase extradiol [Bacteroidales bacterium]